jgi:hypothetical protein
LQLVARRCSLAAKGPSADPASNGSRQCQPNLAEGHQPFVSGRSPACPCENASRTTLTRERAASNRANLLQSPSRRRQTSSARGQRLREVEPVACPMAGESASAWTRLPARWLASRVLRFRPDPTRLDSNSGRRISRKPVQVVLGGAGEHSYQDDASIVDRRDFRHRRLGVLIPDNDKHPWRQRDSRRYVPSACVGEPVGVDTVVVNPQIPVHGSAHDRSSCGFRRIDPTGPD